MSDEPAHCGRPTKSGQPCGNLLRRFERACHIHATDEDGAVSALLHDAYSAGYENGRAAGRWEARREFERAARDATRRELFRTHHNGRQIVQVNGYAYLAPPGVELKVGDEVLLPSSGLFFDGGWFAVTRIGTDYTGALADVLRTRTNRPSAP